MDPDKCLAELVELATEVVNREEVSLEDYQGRASRACELVLALNEWMERGGFVPKAWTKVDRPGRF